MFGRWFGSARTDRHYARGLDCFHRGELRAAVEAFEASLAVGGSADHPTTALATFYKAEAHARLGRAALASREWSEAADEFELALEIQPSFPDLHFCHGLAALELGRPHDALADAGRALGFNPRYLEAEALSYLCHLQLEERLLSEQSHLRCQEMAAERDEPLAVLLQSGPPPSVEQLTELLLEGLRRRERIEHATSLLEQGFWKEARDAFLRLVAAHPRYPDLRVNLAKCHYGLGDPAAALEELEHALRLRPGLAPANVLMGVLRLSRHEVGEARDCFARALEREPHSNFARYGLGAADVLLGSVADARRLAEALVREHPESAAALRLLCFSRAAVGDAESTRESLLRWIAMADREPAVALDQIAVALDGGFGDLAERLLDRLDDGAADAATTLARASVARQKGKPGRALELLRLGRESLGEVESLLVESAELSLELGEPRTAVDALAGLGSRELRPRLLLARALRGTGRAPEAVRLLRESPCLSLDGRIELLLARRGAGQVSEADAELRELERLAPLSSAVRAQDPHRWCEPFRAVAREAEATR